MTTNKMTYAQALEMVLNGEALNDEAMDKIKALHEQLTKKAANKTKSDKPTKKQVENAEYAEQLLNLMAAHPDDNLTISEWQEYGEPFSEMSNQKISALLRLLREQGKVIRETVKGKSYFTIAK